VRLPRSGSNIRTTVGDRDDNNEFAVQGPYLSDSNLGEEETLSYDTGAKRVGDRSTFTSGDKETLLVTRQTIEPSDFSLAVQEDRQKETDDCDRDHQPPHGKLHAG
jgi:hypothetical protein